MIVGILGKDVKGWANAQLKRALERRGATFMFCSFHRLVARVGYPPAASMNDLDIVKNMKALIVRPIGRGSVEEIIFRMDLLHSLERHGVLVVNPPRAIERCVDKYYALTLLEENGLDVPRTVVTESVEEALEGFHKLGGDVIFKPLFGSRGIGSTRISDENVAVRIFGSVRFHHGVLYLQEFVNHGNSDIRVFVVGDRVVAAMRRVGKTWKTNVSQGASPVAIQLDEASESLAVKAAKVVNCKVAGVDILESNKGYLIVELNSQPGWRGLQSVTQTNIADCIVDYMLSEVKR